MQQAVSADDPFPITLKEHGPDFLMERRHLWMRTPRQSAILRIRATIMRAAQEFFDTQDFTRTDPPILTPAACEGTSELFEMKYFDEGNAYLTQSGQLYIEATALALGKVYSFGPTFRAEKVEDAPPPDRVLDDRAGGRLRRSGRPDAAGRGLSDAHRDVRVLEKHRIDLKTITGG